METSLLAAGGAADLLRQGSEVSAEQARLVVQLGEMLASHAAGLREAVKLLQGLMQNQAKFQQDIAQLQAQLANLHN